MVVKQERRQGPSILIFELQGQVLHKVVKAPLVRTLLELYIVAVAKGWSNAAVDSERTPLVLALGNWYSEILVFRVPGTLLNQLCVESGPEAEVTGQRHLLIAVEDWHVVVNHGLEADSKGSSHLLQNVWWMFCRAEGSLCEFVLYAVHLIHIFYAVNRHLDSVLLFEQHSSLWQ